MLKRLAAFTAVAVLALSGTAHAAQFNATQLQAILDKAQQSAGPGFAALPQSTAPKASTSTVLPGIVGSGTRDVNGNGHLYYASGTQISTPAVAKSAFAKVEDEQTSVHYTDATSTPVGFKTQKIKGRPVTFFEQTLPATVNGVPTTETRAWGALVDGRTVVQLSVDNADAATARANLRAWVTSYLTS
jgi:hypothetical protein